MARKRLSMRKVKQILRLKWEMELSNRAISRSLKAGRETVREYIERAKAAGYSRWDQVRDISEEELECKLFPASCTEQKANENRRIPDWKKIHEELGHKGVTLNLLWQEYMQEEPETAYRYSQFCNLYRSWKSKLPAVMAQRYKGGQYLFVDYAGVTVPWTDPATGEERQAQIFVAALGASSFTYAEAQPGQDLSSWINGHVNLFEYIGGVPEIVVPDNLKCPSVFQFLYQLS